MSFRGVFVCLMSVFGLSRGARMGVISGGKA
jgi:hypothetical protein